MKKFYCRLGVGLSLLLLAGCATSPPPPPMHLTGNPVADGEEMIAHGPPKDRVLWQYRTASAAMHRGDFATARRVLDDALVTLGGIYGRDKSARRARNVFAGEDKKRFIGEPYERVMAYYYRGILYWMDGEPDNARACFRTGEIEDGDAEKSEYAADYVLLDYLDGLASTKLGEDGSDALKRAQAESKFGAPVPYNRSGNVLFFLEFGKGPSKYATGRYREELRFSPGNLAVRSASVRIENQMMLLQPYDDLYFQATTRGGRVMDHILANKAIFKTTTDEVGTGALLGGAILGSQQGHHDSRDEIGAGLLAFGVLSKIISGAAVPAADTRSWDNLPQFLSFTSLKLPPGTHQAMVEFKDGQGHVLPSYTKTITIQVPSDGRDKVVFVSDRSITPQTL